MVPLLSLAEKNCRCYITPLIGAWIADSYWGRFKTICVAVFVALVGHIILIIAAVPGVIEEKSAVGAFVVALIVMGFGQSKFFSLPILSDRLSSGTGLFKANISPLVAEQYKRTKLFVITTKSGERVIVDPALTVSRVYMVRNSIAISPRMCDQPPFCSISISSSTSVPLSARSPCRTPRSSLDSTSPIPFPPSSSSSAPSSYGLVVTSTIDRPQLGPSSRPLSVCGAMLLVANGAGTPSGCTGISPPLVSGRTQSPASKSRNPSG